MYCLLSSYIRDTNSVIIIYIYMGHSFAIYDKEVMFNLCHYFIYHIYVYDNRHPPKIPATEF